MLREDAHLQKQVSGLGMLSLGGACRRDIQAAKPTGVPAALIS